MNEGAAVGKVRYTRKVNTLGRRRTLLNKSVMRTNKHCQTLSHTVTHLNNKVTKKQRPFFKPFFKQKGFKRVGLKPWKNYPNKWRITQKAELVKEKVSIKNNVM